MTTLPILCTCDTPEGVEKLKLKDDQAWQDLFRCYSGKLRHDILVSLMKRSLLEDSLIDIEQDTWLTASNKINAFIWRGKGSLYNWLRAISLNHVLNRIPRTRRRAETLSMDSLDYGDSTGFLDEFFALQGLVQNSAESDLIRREEKSELLSIIFENEKPTDITIAIQVWVEGIKPHEVAALYGVKPRTISQRLYLMKNRLECLESIIETMLLPHE